MSGQIYVVQFTLGWTIIACVYNYGYVLVFSSFINLIYILFTVSNWPAETLLQSLPAFFYLDPYSRKFKFILITHASIYEMWLSIKKISDILNKRQTGKKYASWLLLSVLLICFQTLANFLVIYSQRFIKQEERKLNVECLEIYF